MQLADLPDEVIADLCQDDRWRLDIDPGLDAKCVVIKRIANL